MSVRCGSVYKLLIFNFYKNAHLYVLKYSETVPEEILSFLLIRQNPVVAHI